MFLQIIVALFIGMGAGIITGLTPGIHVNLVSVFCVSISPWLLEFVHPLSLGCFIISLAVTHTFLDNIPSVFLGAPDSDTALGVLPGHRYLLKGLGLMAVKLTTVGSYGGLVLSFLLFVPLIPVVKYGYPLLQDYIGWIILIVVVFMILREKRMIWAIVIFSMSGLLGVLTFGIPNVYEPLFPLFSGLFGVATLLYSLFESETLPVQKDEERIQLDGKLTVKALFAGEFAGFITAIMPGLGGSTAAVIGIQFVKKLGDHGFMILMGAINTVNFCLSLVALLVLDKARNGAIVSLQKILSPTPFMIAVFVVVGLIAGSLSVFLTLKCARLFAQLVKYVNYKKLVVSIILFIVIMVAVLCGWKGLLILVVGTAVGLLPAIVKISRTHTMGCLLVPVMIYFLL